ncbi:glycosyltransferase involved in cell wall biosynthesis [Novosphingobium hassiacum]|uniref:Glycosyltransferase involved in cell wall biosynthesis n=1 Tax=Novosphingobium hassiacum TaxID=173676 RepID=A0A7W6EXG1_9SPHN|nr:glycosyltransferase family A protein [Novosphingobium hassiacum]MBB3861814.1 glycosyltransferase involved in cell wall biosynthesis [Novosphingobium hassiacum]
MSAPASPYIHSPCRPRVAVIVPAYGVAHLVGEALASLQCQTMPDWECIVIDDGAPDDVAAAVAPYLTDHRISFLATPNGGVSTARNRAIAATSAPLIALLDGDDLFRPAYLETMVAVLESDPNVRLATCNARIFGAVSRERTCVEAKQGTGDGVRGSLADVLDRSFNVYIGTTFRRADFKAVGGFDTTMAQSEDFDLWVRLMLRGGVAYYVDTVLGDYRVRPGSASSNAGRMLLGNIKVYEKARALLPEGSVESQLIDRLLADNRASLSFEHAMDRIIDGDTRTGLAELRNIVRAGGIVGGPVWRAAFALWQIFPPLARPMLRWRRRAHSRGGTASAATYSSHLEMEG